METTKFCVRLHQDLKKDFDDLIPWGMKAVVINGLIRALMDAIKKNPANRNKYMSQMMEKKLEIDIL